MGTCNDEPGMNLFDIRTILFSYVITNAVCAVVVAALWFRNRQRFAGLGFWLADFILQFFVILFVALRGILPDFLSIVLSNSLAIAGTILLYQGLALFVHQKVSQTHNYFLLAAFFCIHTYFAFVQPCLSLRTINLATGIILLGAQCAWLLIYRVEAELRSITRGVGQIFLTICLFSSLRVVLLLIVDPGNDFLQAGIFEALAVLLNQMLFIILTFGLVLMVNRRLILALEHDLLQREKADEELRKLSRTVEQSQVSVIITDTNGAIEYVNPKFCEVTGYAFDEVHGKNPRILRPNGGVSEAYRELWDTITAGRMWHGEFHNRKKNGELFWESTIISPILNEHGRITHYVAVKEDITERKRAEESLLQLTALEERQRLARNLHDSVNQSIHSLLLFAETLVSLLEKNNTERARQIAGRMEESARQALKETRLMLYEFQPPAPGESVDLMRDMERRVAMVERRAGVRVQIQQEGSLSHCPPAWYEDLFWITIEALNNALKHAQARNMQITIRCSAHQMELSITDNGIGFDPAKPRPGGLGLQTMRERAGILGGELTIHSMPGQGSTVHFRADIEEFHGSH